MLGQYSDRINAPIAAAADRTNAFVLILCNFFLQRREKKLCMRLQSGSSAFNMRLVEPRPLPYERQRYSNANLIDSRMMGGERTRVVLRSLREKEIRSRSFIRHSVDKCIHVCMQIRPGSTAARYTTAPGPPSPEAGDTDDRPYQPYDIVMM
jgi:hypothetical protein